MEVSADAAYERPCERRAEHNEAGEHYIRLLNMEIRRKENKKTSIAFPAL